MLRAVTFDFWNTLFVDARGKERELRRAEILHAELEAAGVTATTVAVQEAFQAGFDFFDRVWVSEQRTPLCAEIVDSILEALRARLPEAARRRVIEEYELVLLDLPPEPVPGAVYALPELEARYRLALICDTGYSPGSVLRQLLERHDMLAAFDYLFFSNEHGMSKPDARVFRHTLAQLDVRPAEAAHVGDIQRTDIAGAQSAGMSAVHFVGANNRDATASTADLLVRHFDEIPAALGGLTCAGC